MAEPYPTEYASLLHRLVETEAVVSQLQDAILACIGDAEGQEAVREHRMLELTKGQVQLLAGAIGAESEAALDVPAANAGWDGAPS